MKKLIAVLMLVAGSAHAAYFDNIVQKPGQAPAGALVLFTSKGSPDGGVGTISPLWHQADPNDSVIPEKIQPYVPPESWGFDIGGGSDGHNGFAYFALDWNVAPQLLSPLTKALTRGGGNYATASQLITQTSANGAATGQGIRLDLGWKTNWLSNGNVPKFDQLRAPPRYGIGYAWTFGGK